MSQYIHSLLIEPVARRFPRASFGSAEALAAPVGANEDPSFATVPQAAHEARPRPSTTPHDEASGITMQREVTARQSHDINIGWPPHGGDARKLVLIEVEILEPAVAARRYEVRSRDECEVSAKTVSNKHTPTSMDIDMASDEPVVLIPNTAAQLEEAPPLQTRNSNGSVHALQVGPGQSSAVTEDALPEDDGMQVMRRRILEIQQAQSPNDIKAKLVHGLMNERYLRNQISERAHSPNSVRSVERSRTPSSPKSTDSLGQSTSSPPSSTSSSMVDAPNPFKLRPDDLRPTLYVKPVQPAKENGGDQSARQSTDMPVRALGCEHYKRNIKLQCSTCDRWHTCRFCHDAVENHMLNRRATKNMLCMLCGCAQPASAECVSCHERAAWYYCNVCKLWDDDPQKSIYHCNDCGICRVGEGLGKDFFHCKTCCVCMSVTIRDTHRCIERSTDCDCPICGEYMFTSPETVVFMRCGHSIHHRCYNEHMKSSYRCPICSRSIVNMEWQFARLERSIEAQPMPEEFRNTKALIYCNDCSAKTSVPYHWLGLKCSLCHSYNTAQISLLAAPSRSSSPDQRHEAHGTATPGHASFGPSRGRQPRSASRPYLQPRASTSVPSSPLPSTLNPFSASLAFPPPAFRDIHSLSPPRRSRYSFGDDDQDVALEGDADAAQHEDDDPEFSDDLDFWGGDGNSPSLWPRPIPNGDFFRLAGRFRGGAGFSLTGGGGDNHNHEQAEAVDANDDDDDADTEYEDEDAEMDEDDEDEDDDKHGIGAMELLGHV